MMEATQKRTSYGTTAPVAAPPVSTSRSQFTRPRNVVEHGREHYRCSVLAPVLICRVETVSLLPSVNVESI